MCVLAVGTRMASSICKSRAVIDAGARGKGLRCLRLNRVLRLYCRISLIYEAVIEAGAAIGADSNYGFCV